MGCAQAMPRRAAPRGSRGAPSVPVDLRGEQVHVKVVPRVFRAHLAVDNGERDALGVLGMGHKGSGIVMHRRWFHL